jgi:hypothetical protein
VTFLLLSFFVFVGLATLPYFSVLLHAYKPLPMPVDTAERTNVILLVISRLLFCIANLLFAGICLAVATGIALG